MLLMEKKQARARIVLAENASECCRYGAFELAKYLGKIGGATLPIVTDDSPWQGSEICLGFTNRPGTPEVSTLKNDGFAWLTRGDTLFITGENDRGTLYGVYRLLEEVLGCRFLSPDVEKIPARDTIELPELNRSFSSPLYYRETFWYGMEHCPDFAVKRGFNSSIFGNFEPRHGGAISYYGFAHTLFMYLSPEEFFDEHPEYFALRDGARQRERTQLCLTNPEVAAIVKKRLRENILAHPECKIFSLTQMDWDNPCTCPECTRVDEEEGSHSGSILRFVNDCAACISQEFPDVMIDTFAYLYSRKPPKHVRPLPNVCVRVCSIECCFSHPLSECDVSTMGPHTEFFAQKDWTRVDPLASENTFQQDLIGWSKICSHMFVWDYTTNYRNYLNPMPNLRSLKSNMKFFIDHGVVGLFEQGNAESPSGEFGELRSYLISKLMWEPDGDVDLWMDEFMTGYYGMAAAPLKEYIGILHDHVAKENIHMGIYELPNKGHIPPWLVEEADRLFDEAEALCEDVEVLQRVRRSRLQIRYVKLYRMDMSDPTREQVVDRFIRDVKAFGLKHVREYVGGGPDMDGTLQEYRAGKF